MALIQSLRIIWLDAYIGQDNECHSFKRMFCTTLEPDARYSDPLDILICALNENAAPFIFVDTWDKAIKEIEFHQDKQIIFISSGSLGQQIIPVIVPKYRHVYSFYIFCAVLENYLEFVIEYSSCLNIFNSELDLLVRLVRDISLEIINKGRSHLEIYDPKVALSFFQRSRKLEQTANEKDQFNGVFLDNIRLLEGYRDDIGLIKKALIMIEEQQGDIQEEQGPIISERDSYGEPQELVHQHPDSPLSQQENAQEYPDAPLAQQIKRNLPNMASAIPTPNHIIIWLDQHIGLVQWNEELKSTVGGQADPNNETPTAPTDGNIGTFIKFRDNMNQSFYEIPDNLKAFSRKKECLECIEDSLKKEKKIFFITSGSLGKTIAPEIINKYKSLKTIYVFCDLLERLLRDVAEYFISEGDTELNRSKQLAYSANIYFGWAKLLLERANKFATRQIFDRLKYVEERIEFTEQLLAQSNGNVDEKMSDESHR